jgi:hypothetical protein
VVYLNLISPCTFLNDFSKWETGRRVISYKYGFAGKNSAGFISVIATLKLKLCVTFPSLTIGLTLKHSVSPLMIGFSKKQTAQGLIKIFNSAFR